jgi:hypothetical protein
VHIVFCRAIWEITFLPPDYGNVRCFTKDGAESRVKHQQWRDSVRPTFLAFYLILFGFFISSCDSDSDDGGTSAGSGTVEQTTATTPPPTVKDSKTETTSQSTSSQVSLKALQDFTCTSNWTNRDGALGLSAYSGNGNCIAKFPGPDGTYRISIKVQTEYDGRPSYTVSLNGNAICGGRYPLSSSLGCDCPHETWYKVCPDKNVILDCGTQKLKNGDSISFWGEEDFACADNHGAYAKWHGITFTPSN